MKLFKFGGKEFKSKMLEKIYEYKYEELVVIYEMIE